MITSETHLEKSSVEQRQALPHLAVSGSLTGGEPMSKCDCPDSTGAPLDSGEHTCAYIPCDLGRQAQTTPSGHTADTRT